MELRRIESLQRIPNDLAAIKTLIERFTSELERQEYDSETTFAIALGFTEAVANAFIHGNKRDANKFITVSYHLDHEGAEIEVSDEGRGFDPSQIPDASSDEGLVRPSGRGVLLMRSLFDGVQFLDGGTCVRLSKRVPTEKACAA
jgi:serine/threonine-protein kinase RsbW